MNINENEISILSVKIDKLSEEQVETTKKVEKIGERLFDPDNGLFSRVKELKNWTEKHEYEDNELRKTISNHYENQNTNYTNINNSITSINSKITPVFNDYISRQKKKKRIDKIVTGIIVALIGIAIKNYFDVDALKAETRKLHDSYNEIANE